MREMADSQEGDCPGTGGLDNQRVRRGAWAKDLQARPGAQLARPSVAGEFTSAQTHGFSKAEFSDVTLTSEGLGWASTFISRQTENPYQKAFETCDDPLVAFIINGPVPFERTINGVSVERKFLSGSFGIVPAGTAFDARNEMPLESMHIYVRQAMVEEIAAEMTKGDPSKIEIIPQFAVFDRFLAQLALGLCEAARDPQLSSPIYVDHLAGAFAARLVKEHSAARLNAPPATKGLSARQLRSVNEYIDANIQTSLALRDLAEVANLSSNHFARLFKKSTGFTPYQYVLKRRVDRAQSLLSRSTLSIAQIAVDSGFGDQTHLTRAFRQLTGVTPASYRKTHK